MHRKACITRYLVQAVPTQQRLFHQILIARDLVVYEHAHNIITDIRSTDEKGSHIQTKIRTSATVEFHYKSSEN